MTQSTFRAAGAAIALACLAGAASAQEISPRGGPAPTAQQQQDRIEELERQLAEATDRADRADHRARQAENEVRRLQEMVNDLAAVRDARDEMEADPRNGGASDERAPDRESRAPSATERAQGSLGTVPASDVDSLPRGPGADAAAIFNRAQDYLAAQQYNQAQRTFSDFLRAYGNDPNAAEARYWRAFALLAMRENNDAALGFTDYLELHPRGPRAPDSMVRLGMALKAQDMIPQACAAFAEFRRRYPRAHPALRDLAARESRGLDCS